MCGNEANAGSKLSVKSVRVSETFPVCLGDLYQLPFFFSLETSFISTWFEIENRFWLLEFNL